MRQLIFAMGSAKVHIDIPGIKILPLNLDIYPKYNRSSYFLQVY